MRREDGISTVFLVLSLHTVLDEGHIVTAILMLDVVYFTGFVPSSVVFHHSRNAKSAQPERSLGRAAGCQR